MKEVMVKIKTHDLYQLLVASCRYGYTRNNHLEPESSFIHVKYYLPLMLKEDREITLTTAKQLCEECINELESRFYNGNDDVFNNRTTYIAFIQWLLKFLCKNDKTFNESQIYNIENYYRNLSEDTRKKFIVYDNMTQEELTGVLTKDEYFQFLLDRYVESNTSERYVLNYRVRDEGSSKIYTLLLGLNQQVKEYRVVNLDYLVEERKEA